MRERSVSFFHYLYLPQYSILKGPQPNKWKGVNNNGANPKKLLFCTRQYFGVGLAFFLKATRDFFEILRPLIILPLVKISRHTVAKNTSLKPLYENREKIHDLLRPPTRWEKDTFIEILAVSEPVLFDCNLTFFCVGYTPEIVGTSPRPPKRPKQSQAPTEVIAGQWYTASIQPLEMWYSTLPIAYPNTNFQMNLTVLNGHLASVAIYGRREAMPTITNFDWVHMVAKDGRVVKRAASEAGITVDKLLDYRGTWYFGVLNDNNDIITVRSVMGQQRNGGKPCPGECNGQGRCEDGVCQCYPQFSGQDCSQSK